MRRSTQRAGKEKNSGRWTVEGRLLKDEEFCCRVVRLLVPNFKEFSWVKVRALLTTGRGRILAVLVRLVRTLLNNEEFSLSVQSATKRARY